MPDLSLALLNESLTSFLAARSPQPFDLESRLRTIIQAKLDSGTSPEEVRDQVEDQLALSLAGTDLEFPQIANLIESLTQRVLSSLGV